MAANLRIIYSNQVDTATVTASSAASPSLGVANLLTDIKSSVWRSIGTGARLDVLLASAAIVSGIALPFTNLSSAATMRVRVTNEPAVTNLLVYPRNFDNAAHQPPVNLSLNPKSAIAPDDQLTGYMALETSTNGLHAQDLAAVQFVNGTTYTFSLVAKPIGGRLVALYLPATLFNGRFAVFDVANGVVINAAPGVTARISYCQNGWYRCSVTETCVNTAFSRPSYMSYNGGISFAGDTTKGLCVWHAQLEAGQNALAAPNEFDNPAHQAPLNLAIGAKNIVAPDDSATGTSVLETAATGMHAQDLAPIQFTGGTAYTFSIAAKPIGGRQLALYFPSVLFKGRFAVFDLVNGTVVTSAPGVTARISYSQNGWYRCSITEVCASGGTARASYFSYNGGISFAGDPAKGLSIWQARVELGGVVTSIIPDATTFVSRGSSKWVFDVNGTLMQVPANVAAIDYDPVTHTSRGLLLEAAATNLIRNNTMRNAAVGAPGTVPANWLAAAVPGLAISIAGLPVVNGVEYIDIRFAGMPTVSGTSNVVFDTVASAASQALAHSVFLAIVAGASPSCSLSVHELDSGSNFLRSNDSAKVIGSVMARQQHSIATGVGTAFVRPMFFFSSTVGVPQDFTIRIGLPQLESGVYATSPIKTSTSAVTRAADISNSPQVTRQVGYMDNWQSYDYDSIYVVACPGGAREVWGWAPQQLNVSSFGFGGGACVRHWIPRMTARAVAIELFDHSNPMGYIEASRLVIGDYWSPKYNMDYGAQSTPVDNTTHDRSGAGDQRVIPGSRHDGLTFNMQWLPPDDRATLVKILRRNGLLAPMFISLYPEAADPLLEADFQVYGRLSSLGALTAHSYGYYSAPIAIEQV